MCGVYCMDCGKGECVDGTFYISEITDEINLWTGGITASVSSGSYGDGGSYRANFILSGFLS